MKTNLLPRYQNSFGQNMDRLPKIIMRIKKIKFLLLLGWMFSSSISFAQNLTFTIDNATTSGDTVFETIVIGGNTYVLTAVASGGPAWLWDNGAGDLMFWSFDGSPGEEWAISVTANGIAANFTLNGFRYTSFGGDQNLA